MDRVIAFISYSTKQKQIAGRLKANLESCCGYEVFVAHDDIPGGTEWAEEIANAIRKCDIFVPLISPDLQQSQFADQEIGFAVCLDKKIIPVKITSLDPYGFINKYQALSYKIVPRTYYHADPDNVKEIALAIGKIGLSYDKTATVYKKARHSVTYALSQSYSFSISNTVIQLIIGCAGFSAEDLKKILHAAKTNSQVAEAYGLGELISFLQKTYGVNID